MLVVLIGPAPPRPPSVCDPAASLDSRAWVVDNRGMSTIQQLKQSVPVPVYWAARKAYFAASPSKRREHRSEVNFYRELLNPGDLCFDVGCHLGRKTKALLACGARVIGVEPEPTAQRMLGLEFARSDRFELVPKGVAAAAGTMTLHRASTLSMTSFRSDWPSEPIDSVDVPVTTLDRLIQQYGRPAYCKIDVEGFELEVFKGLSTAIPLISFEFLKREKATAVACLEQLEKLGQVTANVTPKDDAEFVFPRFISVDQIVEHLESGPAYGRGDMYVAVD